MGSNNRVDMERHFSYSAPQYISLDLAYYYGRLNKSTTSVDRK